MDFQDLKKNGLLKQYVLGLTTRQETALVEEALEKDPAAREEYDRLLREMDTFVETYGIEAPASSEPGRRSIDFEHLDHEMITLISSRNQRLVIWRYVLGGVTLLLLFVCGYLFRQLYLQDAQVISLEARHVQDVNSHERALRKLEDQKIDWAAISSATVSISGGELHLHQLPSRNLVLVDLSHAPALEPGDAYYLTYGSGKKRTSRITPADQDGLHPVRITPEGGTLRLYVHAAASTLDGATTGATPLVSYDFANLPVTQ